MIIKYGYIFSKRQLEKNNIIDINQLEELENSKDAIKLYSDMKRTHFSFR